VSEPWPGLEPSVTAIGLILIPLGLWHTFYTGSEAVEVARLTTWDMVAAAAALSAFIGWRWSRTIAELALSLWTVAFAAFGATTAMQIAGPAEPIDLLPAVQTGVLVGLTAAGLLWYWLAGVWRQQLREGRPWTVAGRLIPLADRIGFLAAALALLVGAKVALWPRMPYGAADNSAVRLVVVSLVYLLLIGMCLFAAKRMGKRTMFYMAGLAAVVWFLFLWLRR
jgi:hypothetical protein